MSDVSEDKTDHNSFTGFLIESDQPASPCGLIAKSVFNGKTKTFLQRVVDDFFIRHLYFKEFNE